MTPQEQQTLDDFLQRLAAVHGVAKDPQADALIRERLAGQPDAAYLLVQRSLLLEQALDNARQQIEQLQQATQRSDPGGSSFLNVGPAPGFGRAPAPPGMYDVPPAQQQVPQPTYREPTWRERLFGGGGPAVTGQPQAVPVSSGPSFLGTAASTAAGVAGGMFLFNGIENMLGHHNNGGVGAGRGFYDNGNNDVGGLLGPGMSPGDRPAVVEEVTNNNFYDSNGQRGRDDDYRQPVADDGSSSWLAGGDDGGDFLDAGDDDDRFA